MIAAVTPLHAGEATPSESDDPGAVGINSLPAIMSPAQLAKELDVSVRTLDMWRASGNGPKARNPEGTRFYRYYGQDVLAWLENKKPAVAAAGQNN